MFSGTWCGSMGAAGWLVMTLFWATFLGLAVWAVTRMFTPTGGPAAEDPRDVLDRRLAAGDLTADEYRSMRDRLSGAARN